MKVAEADGAGLCVGAVELVELARASLGDMAAEQHDEGWRSLEDRLAVHRRARARARWTALAAGALCCGVALGGALVWHDGQRHTPISFRIEGGDLRPGGSIEAGPVERPVIHFSEGSELRLTEGTQVRVRSVDEHGARVTLGEGSAHVYV
ncbi:MAG: hypothetical protein M3O46_16460, partial [Myxococcota bacterium]|nr:hypothetical protein [Myxococcota bacterium]